MNNYNVIRHYASPYYDPVKAHEYYEEHKKLKGRTTLNDSGKEALAYVKNQLKTEKETSDATNKSIKDTRLEDAKSTMDSQVTSYTKTTNDKIARLTAKIKNLSGPNKKARQAQIKSIIAKLRSDNEKKKSELQKAYNKSAKDEKERYSERKQAINEDYKSKLEEETNKINSEFAKSSTKTTTSSQPTQHYSMDEIKEKLNAYKKSKR